MPPVLVVEWIAHTSDDPTHGGRTQEKNTHSPTFVPVTDDANPYDRRRGGVLENKTCSPT